MQTQMRSAPAASLFRAQTMTVNRMGYGAMQLAGPGVFRTAAVSVGFRNRCFARGG